jgi:uncharacterized membrane protein SpoIIM required for sporulation
MKTVDFINERKNTWLSLDKSVRELSGIIRHGTIDDKQLVSLMNNYRRTVADLSLAQSLYPKDPLVSQLSSLVTRALVLVAAYQENDMARLKRFFSSTLPQLVLRLKNLFLVSFTVFILSALFGFFFTMIDPYAANAIAGDQYIFMTLENIENGKPFAVYQSGLKYAMSAFIMSNNIKVAFTVFAFGVFYGIGTFIVLIFNGLMLGSIAAIFASHGLLFDFSTTVLIHGTLELFAILVAGAAGIRLGQSMFNPGDLTRSEALFRFGVEAFQLCAIMVPVFVIAGILEAYVTPLDLMRAQRMEIICTSIAFLLIYLGLPTLLYIRSKNVFKERIVAPEIRL